jgi:hypothetical protein
LRYIADVNGRFCSHRQRKNGIHLPVLLSSIDFMALPPQTLAR